MCKKFDSIQAKLFPLKGIPALMFVWGSIGSATLSW